MSVIKEKFDGFKASKTVLVWSCLGTAVLTMVVGFTWGGWVTGGSAQQRADDAARQATASLAADLCFDNFMAAPNARTQLMALKDESSYQRDNFVEDGGWTTLGGQDKPVSGAAGLCADRLAEAELPMETDTGTGTTAVSEQTTSLN